MQVYRFVKESRIDGNNLFDGNENEARNLTKYGLISPSSIYLQSPVFQVEYGYNTFGKDIEMSKYFFGSLTELFVSLRMNYENGFFSQGEKFSQSSLYTIMGIDLPSSVLHKHLGFGYYNRYDFVEFRVPYFFLMHFLGKNLPAYFVDLMQFYNANLSTNRIESLDEYKMFEAFRTEDMEAIYAYNRLSLYPLFCFEPKKMDVFSIDYEGRELQEVIYEYDELARWYIQERGRVDYKCSMQSEECFTKMVDALEKENNVFKRELILK